ncbi:MAG: helix-turn-helix domain-containing protein [Thermoplasmatota archaeon]
MKEIPSLTYREKVLIYLNKYYDSLGEDNIPLEVTQEGISEKMDMSRTHVSRTVRKLIDDNLIDEKKSHIESRKRKLKTYHLTHKGFLKSRQLISKLSDINIRILQQGKDSEIPLTDVSDFTNGKVSLVEAINKLENDDESLNVDEEGPINPVRKIENLPDVEELYGREEEIDKLYDWIEGDVPVLVLLGRKGFGNSSLTSKFVNEIENRHILSINISQNSGKKVIETIKCFYDEIDDTSRDLIDGLKSQKCLLILDDYYEVSDDVVDFLSDLLGSIDRNENLKVLINAREGTPVYERFYTMDDIHEGKVKEISLSPLNKENAQKVLGNKIEDESLRRIMQFTKGSPLLLKLLKEDKREKLEAVTPLSKEQVSLLMFLKTRTE